MHKTIHITTHVMNREPEIVAVAQAHESDLYADGVLNEKLAAKALAQALGHLPANLELEGMSFNYLNAAGLPEVTEFWSSYLPEGCCARSSVYLSSGVRYFRFQLNRPTAPLVLGLLSA